MKNSLKKAFSAVAVAALAVSAVSMNAFAEGDDAIYPADQGLTSAEIDAAATKPVITLTKEVITLEEATSNPTRQITLTVSNADYKYCSTGFHVYYDSRLDCAVNPLGIPSVSKGPATDFLTAGNPAVDPTAADYNMEGVFLTTMGNLDGGQNGTLWTLNLTLPSDVKEGDVFPIDILYRSSENNKDLFNNNARDAEGKAMMAYAFTRGIYSAEYNNNFTAPAEDVAQCAALANIDKSYDGYIAIAGAPVTTAPPTTTTTAPPTTTTTAAPTTTSTAAPVTTASTSAAPAPGTTVSTSTGSAATGKATTTKKVTTAKAVTTTGKKGDSPKTGVAGVGVAAAGLAVALGTAFVLRKKED